MLLLTLAGLQSRCGEPGQVYEHRAVVTDQASQLFRRDCALGGRRRERLLRGTGCWVGALAVAGVHGHPHGLCLWCAAGGEHGPSS